MSLPRRAGLLCTLGILSVWLYFRFPWAASDPAGRACIALGVFFAVCMVLRWKSDRGSPPAWIPAAPAAAGLVASAAGAFFGIRQMEWMGLLAILYGALRWSLPGRSARDAVLALLFLYLIHPLPQPVVAVLRQASQRLLVTGSEWFLHLFGIPAWADAGDSILYARDLALSISGQPGDYGLYVAVFLGCLGAGFVFRFAWYAFAAFLAAGLIQAFVLGCLRIVLTVSMASVRPVEWPAFFLLHSTAGLIVCVLALVEIEAAVLQYFRVRHEKREKAINEGTVEPAERGSIFHPFWHKLFRSRYGIVALVLLLACVPVVTYRQRPAHRARMTARLAGGLIATNPKQAHAAALAAVRRDSGNADARFALAQVLVSRRDYDKAIAELGKIPPEFFGTAETVVKAQALAGLKRFDEAATLVGALQGETRYIPAGAIVIAEIAAARDNAKIVAENLQIAANSPPLIGRVRALFPYLASRGQWQAIALADRDTPYSEPASAAIAVEARIRLNDIQGAGNALKLAIGRWPDEPRLLRHLLTLAAGKPESEWNAIFTAHFVRNLAALNSDELAAYLPHCFRLSRPDLAWLAYSQLERLDPADPDLQMVVARFGQDWCAFSRSYFGYSAVRTADRIDLRNMYASSKSRWPFDMMWSVVPLAEELCNGWSDAARDKYLALCLGELDRRAKTGRLSLRLQMTRATALSATGRYREAHNQLAQVEKEYPAARQQVLSRRLTLNYLEKDWEKGYETAFEYSAAAASPDLTIMLAQADSLLRLDRGMHAMTVAEQVLRSFPDSPQAILLIASIFNAYGMKEEALFTLGKVRGSARMPATASLLFDTGRLAEAVRAGQASGNTDILRRPPGEPEETPPPAELAVSQQWRPPLTDGAMDSEAALAEAAASGLSSPFLRGEMELAALWYRSRGAGASSDPVRWAGIGRDPVERSAALCRLSTLLARQRRYDEAGAVLTRATGLTPGSRVLWRMRVACSGGDAGIIRQARDACPDDPDIWLAGIVSRTRNEGAGKWADAEVAGTISSNTFSVGTVVRAGDFLLRNGMKAAADAAARDAAKRDKGYLPAYVLALKCAPADKKWVRACEQKIAELANDPGRRIQRPVGAATPDGQQTGTGEAAYFAGGNVGDTSLEMPLIIERDPLPAYDDAPLPAQP